MSEFKLTVIDNNTKNNPYPVDMIITEVVGEVTHKVCMEDGVLTITYEEALKFAIELAKVAIAGLSKERM